MRDLLIGTQTALTDGNQHLTYEYKILIQNVPASYHCETYGIQVAILETGEVSRIPNITSESTRILKLCDTLCRNTVSPCTLRDVIEDWL